MYDIKGLEKLKDANKVDLGEGTAIGIIMEILDKPEVGGLTPENRMYKGWLIIQKMKEIGWEFVGKRYPQN